MKLPKLCRNKTRDRAFVLERGKRIYLGKWGAPETEAAYKLYIHNLTTGLPTTPPTGSGSVTLMELAAAFMKARANYYVKNGRQTHQLERFKQALEFPLRYYGAVCMDEFGPRKLLECRALMEESGRFSRKYINVLIVCFRGVVKFGVENELVKPETLVALQAISPLKRGRSCARDYPPVAAVPAEVVDATIPFLSPTVAAMVTIQRLTGMRPCEVCAMQAGDVSTDGDIWVYTIRSDKTDYRRAPWAKKLIPLGPKAQAVLFPYLLEREGTPEAFLFSPRDAALERAREARANRKTPITKQTQTRDARTNRRQYAEHYTVDAYERALRRAIKAGNLPHWTPNQLRHLYATEIRAKYGLEASQLMLGHTRADVTQIYAERDFKKALDVARKEG
ncbi:MAG: site-specific integrase [Thermoguttaceae bacterium]|nr:site-specific integrase [Thermoguttaceae bacterium]